MSQILKDPDGRIGLDLSRRGLGSLMFAGFALAGKSALAEPVKTSADGLVETQVLIGPDKLPVHLARPSAKGRHPVILVASEVFGVHEYIRDICRRLAREGYVAVAPAFFFRAGDPAGLSDFAAIRKIVATATNDQVMGDIEETLTWLQAQPFARPSALGITGFCWGGNVVWMAASQFDQIKAGVAWYGRLAVPADRTADPERRHPVEIAASLKAPVLGLYAGKDQGIPLSDVDAMRAALAAAGRPDQIVVYPDAEHGFHADYRASYNAKAAQDGWTRMLAHFRASGVA